MVVYLHVADAGRGELEGPDRRTSVQILRVYGQQVLVDVALDAARLATAVGHLVA